MRREFCFATPWQISSRFSRRVISGRNHSRYERDSRYHLPRTRSYTIHHSQRNPVSMQPPRQKRNVETRVRGLWEDRPTHACLRHCLDHKRLHTLWTLLRLLVAERTRAREVGKRKPIATASDFVQKSLALRNEIVIAGESQRTPPGTLPSHPTQSGSVFQSSRSSARQPMACARERTVSMFAFLMFFCRCSYC